MVVHSLKLVGIHDLICSLFMILDCVGFCVVVTIHFVGFCFKFCMARNRNSVVYSLFNSSMGHLGL